MHNKIIPSAKKTYSLGGMAPSIEGGIEAPLQFNFFMKYQKANIC